MSNKAPILRQNKLDVLMTKYYSEFDEFQMNSPDLLPGIIQPRFDEVFYRKHLTLTHKTKRFIWKRI